MERAHLVSRLIRLTVEIKQGLEASEAAEYLRDIADELEK